MKAIEASNKHTFSSIIKPEPIARRESTENVVKGETEKEMSDQERVLLLYIANLTLLSQHPMVLAHCEGLLYNMEHASALFKANIHKCLAFALF